MEQSLTSLTYKGSIPEAITEAKTERKLFVVYISGKNDESSRLESSTWTDLHVVDLVTKYCILLHIPQESTDAANFSAIYPQKSVPCITAIGYNGIQLWQNEGFVGAEVLASSLEKAWLGLHVQETTATVLSSALASNRSQSSTSGDPKTVSADEESSSSTAVISDQVYASSTVVPSPVIDRNGQPADAIGVASDTVNETIGHNCTVEEKNEDLGYKTSSKSVDAKELERVGHEKSNCPTKSSQGVQIVARQDLDNSGVDNTSSFAQGGSSGPEQTTVSHSTDSGEGSQAFKIEKKEIVQIEKAEVEDDKKVDAFENCTRAQKSSDVHLNIRLPNSVSLKQKFSVTSTMRMVKDYVDENQESGIGAYDLAIPYPRKVFCDQDLSQSLSDLGLFDRQALIVVPRQQGTSYLSGRFAFSDKTDSRNTVSSSDASNGGYFSYVKRFLSFFNPFSYLGGGTTSSSSAQQSQNAMREYRPNPIVRNDTQNTSTNGGSEGKKGQPPASGFGSNIHTLKHDEDDERFNDRNAFWNGNSTQYGGNDDRK